jgi:surface protein
MKKILVSSLLCIGLISSLSAVETAGKVKLSKSPIDLNFLSVENGGSLSAIDSYSDGIGMKIIGVPEGKVIDNSIMNSAVFTYGIQAKTAESPLKSYLNDVVGSGSGENIEIIGGAVVGGSVIGEPCNDGKANTINDVYVDNNGTCKGIVEKNSNECYGDEIGSTFIFNGNEYTVVDDFSVRDVVYNFVEFAEFLCVSNVTDMNYLFAERTNIPDISGWDVSHVSNMQGMFYRATFNQNISNWDVSNVSNMSVMFQQTAFNQPLNNWDVSNVLNMYGMFAETTAFNQPLNNWDVSRVRDFGFMFGVATAFNQPLNNWNTGMAEFMGFMFMEATAFNQPLNNWNTSNVYNMSYMFYGSSAFNQDISNWNILNVSDTGTFIWDFFADSGLNPLFVPNPY